MDIASHLDIEGRHRKLSVDDVAFLGLVLLFSVCYSLYFKDKPDPYQHVWFEKPQGSGSNLKEAEIRDIGKKLEQTVSTLGLSRL